MLDEEVIVKNAKNSNERLLVANVLIMVLFPAVMMGGNSILATGLFMALGILAPINVLYYRRVWIDAPPRVSLFYTLALFPYFISFAIACVGLSNPSLNSVFVGPREYLSLDVSHIGSLTSAADGILSALIPEIITMSAVACGLSIYFITDSRYIIRRMFFFCLAGATALAIFGFFYSFITCLPGFTYLPRFGINPFSTFSDSSQWCGFAMIWMGAGATVAIYSAQRFRLKRYAYSLRFLALLMSMLLFLSILFCGTPMHVLLAALLMAVAFFILFIDTVPTKKNLDRHWNWRHSSPSRKPFSLALPSVLYALISVAMIAGAVMIYSNYRAGGMESLLVDSHNPNSPSLSERQALLDDSMDIVRLNPEFGWGTASFGNVLAFYQGSDLGDSPWPTPGSDLLHKLIENGYVGLFLSAITPLCFFAMWLARRDFSLSGIMMFATVGVFLVLAAVDYPFQSIAVQSSFWVLLMSAFRWDNAEVR